MKPCKHERIARIEDTKEILCLVCGFWLKEFSMKGYKYWDSQWTSKRLGEKKVKQ